ncbi:helix-turn-helix domain-containing protein [Eleftheria terrae]|uniref:helix-turn-helix domain-containing protein n=1 Tax=Eleftheria terrae TaxID=1597781 RepID=UPI00263AC902|nr:helix-turn-helix domain-containing protein [Eleftheria terrae]WKB52297.1 helix-turn-helix domain-containing protein [Eleftheria terrae]
MSLADFADDRGRCWPAVDTLALRTCLHPRTVQRSLRWLEKVGLLRVEKNAMRANLYTLCPDAYEAAPEQQMQPPEVLPAAADCHPKKAAQRHPKAETQRHPTPGTQSHLPRHSATQTVIEPSEEEITPLPPSQGEPGVSESLPDAAHAAARPVKRDSARGPIALQTWLAECTAQGVQPIPPGDPVFRYCETVGIDRETLALHWFEFKRRRSDAGKRQRDWRRTFRNSVEGNWYRLWVLQGNGTCKLTTQGLQAQANRRALEDQADQEGGHAAA